MPDLDLPDDLRRLLTRTPVKDQAARIYAALLPEITTTAARQTDTSINSHGLMLALALVTIAAKRAGRADVENLAAAVMQGDQYTWRYAASGDDDDHSLIMDARCELLEAAERIAEQDWGV